VSPAEEHAQVINLMDALKKSVAQAQEKAARCRGPAAEEGGPAGRAGKTGKRKTS